MKSKWVLTIGILLAGLFLYAGVGLAADTVSMPEWTQIIEQMAGKGKINWSEGYIEAVGIGAPPERFIGKPQARPLALRAARVDAYRNLLELTKGVRVDSMTVVKDFAVESDVINTQVEGVVKDAHLVKQDYLSDGTVEITLRMPLAGGFSQVIIPRLMQKRSVPPEPAAPLAPPAAAPPEPAAPAPAAPPEVFTGLVIDARGLQARPAMSPKILDESGKEVYGSLNVDREYAIQQGMSGYARDLNAAQSNARVTNNPVSLKGLRTEGPGRSDIVISNADANKIRGAAENLSFLKQCRVMIVLD
ncbi:MAG: hypothetical protein M0P04_01365 [Syntrophales bacterium]|nr:hypothetical protein [Syntrophales bacterium]MDD4338438.1 hypothetical protein [Syntrophales bacterium]HOG07836.1 hypothetical protein [Syntrophales bacterium]HOS78537.1 hypothetical protein [Syntrophales bacterium]HPB70599.1 hypothetical protein [Syntrophales bacterium]